MSDQQTSSTDNASQEPHGDEGNENAETPTVEDLLAKIEEITKESRKWESRSKANKDAADRLAEIEREKMTDAEKADADRLATEQRVTDAEKERDEAKAAHARLLIVHEFGLDAEDTAALEGVTDPDVLRTLAERLAGRTPSGPKPDPTQGRRNSQTGPQTPAQKFASALDGLL